MSSTMEKCIHRFTIWEYWWKIDAQRNGMPSKITSSLPAGKNFRVGKLCIFTSSISLAVESILAMTILSWSAYFSASWSQMGASCLQWPHHGASEINEQQNIWIWTSTAYLNLPFNSWSEHQNNGSLHYLFISKLQKISKLKHLYIMALLFSRPLVWRITMITTALRTAKSCRKTNYLTLHHCQDGHM